MSMSYTAGRYKAFDDNGAPLSGGRLYTYVSGTTTFQAAYTTAALATPCTYTPDGLGGQYILLDARGEAEVWLGGLVYTLTPRTALGGMLPSQDGVSDGTAALIALEAKLAGTGAGQGAALVGGATHHYPAVMSQSATGIPNGTLIYFKGRTNATDGGGGVFIYDSASTWVADDVNIYAPSAGPGRYIRVGQVTEDTKSLANVVHAGANGDNVTSANNGIAFNKLLAKGGTILVPDGTYALGTSGLSSAYDSGITGPGSATRRYNFIGQSAANAILTYSGTDYLFRATGKEALGSGALDDGYHSFDNFGNMTLLSANVGANNGVRYGGKAFFNMSNMHIAGFVEGVRLDSCISSSLSNMYLRANVYGLVLSGATYPRAANALTINRMTMQLNTAWGLLAESLGESNVFTGWNVESCGTQGDPNTGGMNINITGAGDGLGVLTIQGVYFEGIAGGAELKITNSGNKHAVVKIDSCVFKRAFSGAYTTNNILLTNTGGGSLRVVYSNCSFYSTNTYTPSSARPFFYRGTGCQLINGGNNTYSETISLPPSQFNRPSASAEMQLLRVSAAGGIIAGDTSVTVVNNSAGVYTCTNSRRWGVDADGYIATATCNSGAALTVQRVQQANDTQIIVVIADQATGVLTNGDFSLNVATLC